MKQIVFQPWLSTTLSFSIKKFGSNSWEEKQRGKDFLKKIQTK